ncbi:MAG: tetratricopeptide repeat protein, partial [Rhodospirillaceae bacterium]
MSPGTPADQSLSWDAAYTLHLQGDLGAAAPAYWALLDGPEDAPGLRRMLALIARVGGSLTLAEELEQADPLEAVSGEVLGRLARLYSNAGFHKEGVTCAKAAIDKQAAHPDLSVILGHGALAAGDAGGAEEAFQAALQADPDSAVAWAGLGQFERARGDIAAARSALDKAAALAPKDPEVQYNLGTLALLQGDFAAGFQAYGARWVLEGATDLPSRMGGDPWTGGDPAGKRLFLYAEQGLGDCLMFFRFAGQLAARGAQVTLEVPARLLPLLAEAAEGVTVVPRGQIAPEQVAAQFDGHCPLMDLPWRLGLGPEDVATEGPYIQAGLDRVVHWRDHLTDGLTIGMAWQGNPDSPLEPDRSIPLLDLLPLLALPAVQYVSLQQGDGLDQLAGLPVDVRLRSFGAALDQDGAFLDTAALMMSMDLVVTSDTSVAHLAGALGRPVWVALSKQASWHWGLGADSTPWYPSMRLFRQDMV